MSHESAFVTCCMYVECPDYSKALGVLDILDSNEYRTLSGYIQGTREVRVSVNDPGFRDAEEVQTVFSAFNKGLKMLSLQLSGYCLIEDSDQMYRMEFVHEKLLLSDCTWLQEVPIEIERELQRKRDELLITYKARPSTDHAGQVYRFVTTTRTGMSKELVDMRDGTSVAIIPEGVTLSEDAVKEIPWFIQHRKDLMFIIRNIVSENHTGVARDITILQRLVNGLS